MRKLILLVTLGAALVQVGVAQAEEMRVTYYNESFATGINYYADESGIIHPYWGSAAASWDIPAGSILSVNGHLVLVIDRGILGSGIPHSHIDVYCPWGHVYCEQMFGWGIYEVYVIRWGWGYSLQLGAFLGSVVQLQGQPPIEILDQSPIIPMGSDVPVDFLSEPLSRTVRSRHLAA